MDSLVDRQLAVNHVWQSSRRNDEFWRINHMNSHYQHVMSIGQTIQIMAGNTINSLWPNHSINDKQSTVDEFGLNTFDE